MASSSYHEKCIAPSVKAMKEELDRISTDKAHPGGAYRNCNVVVQEQLWKEAVKKERNTSKEWYGV